MTLDQDNDADKRAYLTLQFWENHNEMWFLRHEYTFGPDLADHVGPFESFQQALEHKMDHGPIGALIRVMDEIPELCMSPDEHLQYMNGRI